uniref:Innexin n=2 Tax=Parascaris TaxID=6254 RepID=A0A914RLV1_PAREQ
MSAKRGRTGKISVFAFSTLVYAFNADHDNKTPSSIQVTFCDINIREIGNINKKTVQCVLMINMFNEKIFLGIWFWLLIVGVLTFLNLIYWSLISFMPGFSRTFIGNNLVLLAFNFSQQLYRFLLCYEKVYRFDLLKSTTDD